MQEIEKYYSSLYQDIRSMQDSLQMKKPLRYNTQIALDLLLQKEVKQKMYILLDERILGTKNQHKINGYTISNATEKLSLFITVYSGR